MQREQEVTENHRRGLQARNNVTILTTGKLR